MKVIGYGICGPGEANRYMRQTLDEFKRLCDEVIILCNNCDQAEIDLIKEYGFEYRRDRREWGRHQWRIKQDFIERDIKQMAEEGDMLVCLDMDEVFDKHLTKEWLQEAPLDAYHVFVVDLWNDPEHFKLESCFWNVRIWRWNGETKFKAKPVHCGLAPEWTYHYHRHAPFILKHYGLMLKEDRARKIERYQKYDPNAVHLDMKYYDMLKDDSARPFDEEAMHKQVDEEVASYKQSKPKEFMAEKKKPRFAYVKNPHGEVIDIPEKHLDQTMKRGGFEFIGWADEQDDEIEQMFEDTDVDPEPQQTNNYNRSTADEKKELDELNAKDDKQMEEQDVEGLMDAPSDQIQAHDQIDQTPPQGLSDIQVTVSNEPPVDPHPKPDPNKAKKEEEAEAKTEQQKTAKTKVEKKKSTAKKATSKKSNKQKTKK